MTALNPITGVLQTRSVGLAGLLAFILAFSIEVLRIPARIVPMPSRLETTILYVLLAWPFVAAWMTLAKPRMQTDRFWTLVQVTVGSFAASTFLGILLSGEEKLLTMVAGTLAICVFVPGSRRLAEAIIPVDGMPFLRGLQLGFLVLAGFLYLNGSFSSISFYSELANLGFIDTHGIYRNTVTMLGIIAACASLSDVSSRKLPSWPALAFDALVAGTAIYMTLRMPAKGAWLTTACVVFAFLALMLRARRFGLVIGTISAMIAATPLIYGRAAKYFEIYQADASSKGLTGRTEFWRHAWNVVDQNGAYLMGFGFDSAYGSAQVFGMAHFHNEFVNAFYCGGAIGVTLLTIWIGWFLFRATQRALQAVVTDGGRLQVFCFLYGVFTASRLFTEAPITNFTEPLPIWMLCSAVLACKAVGATAPAPAPSVARSRWGGLVAPPARRAA